MKRLERKYNEIKEGNKTDLQIFAEGVKIGVQDVALALAPVLLIASTVALVKLTKK